ncbi:MAG: endonuclease/exonuclease/phosphatase family protein [Planctomycetaceae bacterium]|nr:endonuclease/exonuclease/phosphatase family protein [Planctomycetaceae bacterium]
MRSHLINFCCWAYFLGGWLLGAFAGESQEQKSVATSGAQVKVMTWNIWHGGQEDGKEVGPARVVDLIRGSGADLVAMQETYGSGEWIANELGFHFHPRGTNVSILSRYPVLEDLSVFEEFKCVGALVEVPKMGPVAFYCIWLPYGADIWLPQIRLKSDDTAMIEATKPSANDLQKILAAIEERLADDKYREVPVVIAGDFNSMSHLDWNSVAMEQYGRVIQWPTSRLMATAQFRDAWRETRPVVDRSVDATWSPRFPEQEQERIDFIYYRAQKLRAIQSQRIREHPSLFPSDHAAVLATLEVIDTSTAATEIQVATWNIRRGYGMDNRTDLERTARGLQSLSADVIGLQEVDLGVRRSGQVNQLKFLGQQLGYHPAFGSFMDYDGGRYGLGLLSRYPLTRIEELRLPEGNEPRVALVAELTLPDNRRVLVVNVHFDWVKDDTFRLAQAKVVAAYLKQVELPWILLGDFNDEPDSATWRLFGEFAISAEKPGDQRGTYPADHPKSEIDFIFVGPVNQWSVSNAEVVPDSQTSDHRPVRATLRLLPR